jgi:long-subunit fatty acid transport protein
LLIPSRPARNGQVDRRSVFHSFCARGLTIASPSASISAQTSTLNPDHDKLGYSIGLTYRFRSGLDLSAAFVHMVYLDRTIDQTLVCQAVELGDQRLCLAGTEAGGQVHNKHVLLWGMQLGYSF